MEQQQRESESIHPLRREAVFPISTGPSRPCLLVGLSLVALCLAASLDAFLWHQAREREDAEIRLQEATAHARSMAVELAALRKEVTSVRFHKALAEMSRLQKEARERVSRTGNGAARQHEAKKRLAKEFPPSWHQRARRLCGYNGELAGDKDARAALADFCKYVPKLLSR